MSKNLCIIPARGGSKRIPRKNIRNFLGKPILAYAIEAALKSEIFSDVMVSTDDQEISSIAKKYGADVPFIRSKQNGNDFATTVDVLIEVIENYKKNNQTFDYICCIYPTAIFATEQKIREAYSKLQIENLDMVLPIMEFSYPIQRSLRLKDDRLSFIYPHYETVRSQDLERCYHDAGQFYFIRTNELLLNKTIFTKNSGGIIIPELEAQDIDNESDWDLAEIKYKLMIK